MCCEISLNDVIFAVCNISAEHEKKNTFFLIIGISYQLRGVNSLIFRILTNSMLKKVYKNENCTAGIENSNLCNVAE